MGSGMSKVVTGLYLGNIRDSEDVASLRRHGVTHVLSVHTGAKPVLEDMSYLCISASDSSSQNLLRESPGCPPAGCRAAESPAIFGYVLGWLLRRHPSPALPEKGREHPRRAGGRQGGVFGGFCLAPRGSQEDAAGARGEPLSF
eukprot:XP_027322643.1 uncharacterized protein LOC106016036 isoform X3 [Anas platyrhynchos]